MTRLTKLYSVLMVLLLLCTSNTFASLINNSDRVSRTNWVNSMGHPEGEMCISILPDNILRIHVYVGFGVSNIEEYPPLRVQYDWGGNTIGITNKVRNSDLVPAVFNGLNGYEAEFVFTINLDHDCSGPNPPSDPWDFDFVYSFVTPNGAGGLELYPVQSLPEVFPPVMFPEVGKPGYTPVYSGQKRLCCLNGPNIGGLIQSSDQPVIAAGTSEIVSTTQQLTANDQENISSSSTRMNALSPFVKVFPNPVSHVLNIELNVQEGDYFQMDILDTNGKQVKSVYQKINTSEQYKLAMDITDLSGGIYFCRVTSVTKTESLKFIKL